MSQDTTTVYNPADVRAWAVKKGLTVGTRGRFPLDVLAAFLSAEPKTLRALATEHGVELGDRLPKSGTVDRLRVCEAVARTVQ